MNLSVIGSEVSRIKTSERTERPLWEKDFVRDSRPPSAAASPPKSRAGLKPEKK